jgi:hypothetical protein
MASITSVTATPSTLDHGSTSDIAVVVDNPSQVATVTVSLDGQSGSGQITVSEALTFSVNPADTGKHGFVVASVDQGGTLAVNPAGNGFVFTAAS